MASAPGCVLNGTGRRAASDLVGRFDSPEHAPMAIEPHGEIPKPPRGSTARRLGKSRPTQGDVDCNVPQCYEYRSA